MQGGDESALDGLPEGRPTGPKWWVMTGTAWYGYGCMCLRAEVDKDAMQIVPECQTKLGCSVAVGRTVRLGSSSRCPSSDATGLQISRMALTGDGLLLLLSS